MLADDLSRLLGIDGYRVQGLEDETEESVTLFVVPEARLPFCPKCGQGCLSVHSTEERTVRHLDAFHRPSYLRFETRMVDCATCGQGAERIDFIDPRKRSTKAFRRYVGGLCKILPNSQVAARMEISDDTVRAMDKEFIAANYPPPDFSKLRVLGIDEIAYRKGQKYITLVCNYETGEIVWTGEGRSAKTLKAFFTLVGSDVCKQIAAVSMDMAAPYIKAVRAACKEARIVFDHFHVAKHLNEAVNDTRKIVMAKAPDAEQSAAKGQRFVLLKRGDTLDDFDRARLDLLLAINGDLTAAYMLKEDFDQFWTCGSPQAAGRFLNRWVNEAIGTGVAPVVRVAKMLRRHKAGLIAYHTFPITNGPLEGLNTKINVLRRSRYGFRDLEYFGLKIRQASIERSAHHAARPQRKIAW